jgi:hypothetical protein
MRIVVIAEIVNSLTQRGRSKSKSVGCLSRAEGSNEGRRGGRPVQHLGAKAEVL